MSTFFGIIVAVKPVAIGKNCSQLSKAISGKIVKKVEKLAQFNFTCHFECFARIWRVEK